MTIRTKLTLGYGLFLVGLLYALFYLILLVGDLSSGNREIGDYFETIHRAGAVPLQLEQIEQHLDHVHAVVGVGVETGVGGDPGFWREQIGGKDGFSRKLRDLRKEVSFAFTDLCGRLRAEEAASCARLEGSWSGVSVRLGEVADGIDALWRSPSHRGFRDLDSKLGGLRGDIVEIQGQAQSLETALQKWIETMIVAIAAQGEAYDSKAIGAALGTTALSLLVGLLILRSIRRPLTELTRAAQALSEGKLDYRVPVRGRDELSQFAIRFNLMARDLGQLDELKNDFLARISHDLKSPLTSMQASSEFLLEGALGDLNPEQRELLELSTQSGNRLSKLISDLLDLARMEAGALRYEMRETDLGELARGLSREFQPRMSSKGIELTVEADSDSTCVSCDPDRIRQTLGNLLENAYLHTPSGGRIQVSVAPRTASNGGPALGGMVLSVIDTGPGIPVEERGMIFEKFHQVVDPGKRREGTGLGLSICRQIVEAHGGSIWVEAPPQGGSAFRFSLP